MLYIHTLDNWWHLVYFSWKSINFKRFNHFLAKISHAVSEATGMHRDQRRVDSVVLYPNKQDKKVSEKLMTTLGTTF